MLFYIGHGLQLIGLITVGICLFSGLSKGDYGQFELIQLLAGVAVFYLGGFLKRRARV